MKFSCPAGLLKGPVERVGEICTGRSPSLKYLMLRAADGILHLSGTDGEIFTAERVDFNHHQLEPGEGIFLASSLQAFFKGLNPSDGVSAHLEGNRLVMKAPGPAKRSVAPGMESRDFPGVPATPYTTLFAIEQEQLKHILRLTTFCIDQMKLGDAGVFCGVHFSMSNGSLTVVATERGNRASVFDSVPVDAVLDRGGGRVECEFILTRKGVLTLKSHLGSGKAVFSANANQTTLHVEMGDLTLLLPTLGGAFPQVAPLVREKLTARLGYEDTTRARLEIGDFEKRLMQVRDVAAYNKDDGFRAQFRVGDNAIRFGATNNLGMEQFDKIPARTDGPTIDFCCNAKYLTEAMQHLGDGEVEMWVVPPVKYIGLRVKNQPDFVHMILPLRD